MKPARVTGKLANTVVECLFLDKKVSWARVLEEVMAGQVKLLGLDNLNNCLSRYLAPIYSAKNVLTRQEAQDYRLILEGGELEANVEADQETETNPDADQDLVPDTIDEVQEPLEEHVQAHSEERTQSRKKLAGSPPQGNREVEKPTWSEEKVLEVNLSQGQTFNSPDKPAREQEAQGDYTPDPALEPTRSWQILSSRIAFQDCPSPELAPSQQAGQIIS
jgi:hypothetical protein